MLSRAVPAVLACRKLLDHLLLLLCLLLLLLVLLLVLRAFAARHAAVLHVRIIALDRGAARRACHPAATCPCLKETQDARLNPCQRTRAGCKEQNDAKVAKC